jgi:hypothetical protein
LSRPFFATRLSEHLGELAFAVDGDLSTYWRTRGEQRPGDWLQVGFEEPTRIDRVELVLGQKKHRFGRVIHVYVTEDGTAWRRVGYRAGRPEDVYRQVREPASQVLLLDPVRVLGVRLVQKGWRDRRWGVAELWTDGPAPP